MYACMSSEGYDRKVIKMLDIFSRCWIFTFLLKCVLIEYFKVSIFTFKFIFISIKETQSYSCFAVRKCSSSFKGIQA